jgi:hypothetical protein
MDLALGNITVIPLKVNKSGILSNVTDMESQSQVGGLVYGNDDRENVAVSGKSSPSPSAKANGSYEPIQTHSTTNTTTYPASIHLPIQPIGD